MSDYAIGDLAIYEGKEVTVIDDLIYLPLRRQIMWIEDGMTRPKWVMIYELSEIEEDKE